VTYCIDVNLDTRICSLVNSRKRNQRAGCSTSTTSDTDLRARDVELGPVGVAGLVQGNVLDAKEVVARGQVLGDVGSDGALVYMLLATTTATWNCGRRTQTRPAQLAIRNDSRLSVRLEPDCASAVPCRSCLARRDLGHIELKWTRVEDIWRRSEGYAPSSRDLLDLRSLCVSVGVTSNLL
jgi:hypothetical protein